MAAGIRLERRDELAVVTFDSPGKRVNTLGTAAIHELERLLDLLESDRDLRGVVLLSAKPTTFLAGADLDELDEIESAQQASTWVERGQQVLRRFEDLAVPSVAAIHGAALGGGLEVALACTWRVATDDPATVLGLPEVQLGLLPALGGTHRLPRLVGLERGLDLLLSGRRLAPREALRIGLVDDVVPPAVLFAAATRRLAAGRRPRRARGWRELLLAGHPLGRRFVFAAAAARAERQTGGFYPAPRAILAAAQAGAKGGRGAGEAVEAARFGELATGPVSRRLIEIFRATRELAAAEETAEDVARPAPVELVGVLGAGFMGSGIAAAAARAGCRVRLLDSSPEALGRGYGFCAERFAELARRRRWRQEEARAALNRIAPTLALEGFRRVDVVVEAVVEDLDVKRELLVRVERQLAPEAILASNTSTLPIGELALGLRHPERVLGLHFLSPVHRMPLVEIVRHAATSEAAIERARSFVLALGKTPVVVRDGPGFYTTRILAPYLAEAGRLLLSGAEVEAIDAAGRAAGFPVGPLTLLDEVGIDVAARAARTLAAAFGSRMPFPEPFARLVESGRIGRKSRRGFYDYRGRRKRPDRTIAHLVGVLPERGAGSLPRAELADRLLFAMVAEATRCLEESIVRCPRDGDLAAVLGLGFPPFLGGPFRLLDSLGASEAIRRLERLVAVAGPAFEPPDLLREMAASGRRFYD